MFCTYEYVETPGISSLYSIIIVCSVTSPSVPVPSLSFWHSQHKNFFFHHNFEWLCLPLKDQLEFLVRDNEQLKAEVKELLNSSALASSSRDQGEILYYWYVGTVFFFYSLSWSKLPHIIFHCVLSLLLSLNAKKKCTQVPFTGIHVVMTHV